MIGFLMENMLRDDTIKRAEVIFMMRQAFFTKMQLHESNWLSQQQTQTCDLSFNRWQLCSSITAVEMTYLNTDRNPIR